MKKLIIAFIAAFSVITVGLVILLVFSINRGEGFVTVSDSETELVNTQTASLEGIDRIDVKFYSDDIVYYTGDTNEVVVKEYKNYTPEEDELAKITTTGITLSVSGKNRNEFHIFGAFNHYSRIEIYLPADYSGSLSTKTSSGDITADYVFKLTGFSSSCSSGDVIFDEIYADEINLAASSGDITIEKAEGKRQITTTSGDVKVYSGSGDTNISTSSGEVTVEKASGLTSLETTSGDIKISDSAGDKKIETSSGEVSVMNSNGLIEASSSSGDIRINESIGAGNIDTTSGEILLELSEVTGDIGLDTSSGDVKLIIPDTTSFNFAVDTSSGDIRTFFDDKLSFDKDQHHAEGTIGDNPSTDVKINTTSGEITVQEY